MEGLFITSLNNKIQEIKPGILGMLNTIKKQSTGNLFGDLTIIKNYVLPKLNLLSSIEQQLSELTNNYQNLSTEKQELDKQLQEKIGQITGLTAKLAELNGNVDTIKNELKTKQFMIDNLNQTINDKEMELNRLEDEYNKLKQERDNLKIQLKTILKSYNPEANDLDTNDKLMKCLIDTLNHLSKSENYEAKLLSFIKSLIDTFKLMLPSIDINNEINSLQEAIDNINLIIYQLSSKIESLNMLIIKYSDLFSNNLLFEQKMSVLDTILEEHVMYESFLKDVRNLIS